MSYYFILFTDYISFRVSFLVWFLVINLAHQLDCQDANSEILLIHLVNLQNKVISDGFVKRK